MKNGILNELISTMKERIPQDMNLANTLADILLHGKGSCLSQIER